MAVSPCELTSQSDGLGLGGAIVKEQPLCALE
jgi:hypothetical protein